MNLRLAPLALSAVLLCPGCVFVGFTLPGSSPPAKVISRDTLAFIETGRTTREDVLMRIGAPAAASADGDVFVYAREYLASSFMFLAISPVAGMSTEQSRHRHVRIEIRFGLDATVTEVRFEKNSFLGPEWRRDRVFDRRRAR